MNLLKRTVVKRHSRMPLFLKRTLASFLSPAKWQQGIVCQRCDGSGHVVNCCANAPRRLTEAYLEKKFPFSASEKSVKELKVSIKEVPKTI